MSERRTALITGASSGIGYELAKLFARAGYDLVLVARSVEPLQRVARELTEGCAGAISVRIIAKDLALPTAAREIVAQLHADTVRMTVLVNNAGVGTYGPFAQADLPMEEAMMQVNMVTLTQLTRLVLPDLLQAGEGYILNVASTAAFQPGPLMAIYYATKAYVLSFSEALANELRGTGVSVTALCPGPTRTAFQERAHMTRSRLASGRIMDATTVARIGYRGLFQRKTIVIPGPGNALLALAVRAVPRGLVTRVVRRLHERRDQAAVT